MELEVETFEERSIFEFCPCDFCVLNGEGSFEEHSAQILIGLYICSQPNSPYRLSQ